MLPGSGMPVLPSWPISMLRMQPCMLCNTPPAAAMQNFFCAGTSPVPPSPTKAAFSGKKSSSARVTAEDDNDEDFLVGVDMTLLHR